jgi:hypothetical protein
VVRQQCTIFNWVNDSTLRESFERCEWRWIIVNGATQSTYTHNTYGAWV